MRPTITPKPVRAESKPGAGTLGSLASAPRDLAPFVIAFCAGGLLLLAIRQTGRA